jgi:glyoxylase-like metal-dependent hydrolase (beta-lactamase superfamily II)
MPNYICATCGTQSPETPQPPANCPICDDERQYVGPQGQQWTTLEQLRTDHHNVFKLQEPNLTGIGTEPTFAIGQRALLIQSPGGNVLWDTVSLIDDETIAAVNALGVVKAIAFSHPHFYSAMVEWSHAFNAPIYLHASNRQYVMRPDPSIVFWEGDTYSFHDGLTLVRCGGHFQGSSVLHWPAGAEGRGALFTDDTLYVVSDRRYVSFMRSYPNHIPLPQRTVEQIVAAVEPYAYDRIYSAWFDRVIPADAKGAVHRSAQRYIKAITEGFADS